MSFENVAQQYVFGKLNGAISAGVFDAVADLPEGQPAEDFPYVVIGNDTHLRWDNDSQVGAESTLTLHIWSRAEGFEETKDLMAAIHALLHRSTATVAGFTIVNCVWEFSDTMTDPDGRTRHGVQRYRLTMQKDFD